MAEPPRSAAYEAQIDSILRGLAGLPGIFNPQRRLAAHQAAAALEREGLTEGTTVGQAASDQAGNVVYRLVRGLDGRLYRQRFRQTINQAAAGGTMESSFTQRGLREDKRELDTARESAIQGFEAGQQSTFAQQAEEWRRAVGGLGETRGAYADWRAQQPVAMPVPTEPTLATPQPSIGAPHAGSGVNSNRGPTLPGGPDRPGGAMGGPDMPRVLGTWQGQGTPNATTIARRYGPGVKIKRRGGNLGYVIVPR